MRAAVVLAAGKGTRLRSPLPKVLHAAAGRSLVGWVVEALRPVGFDRIVVVVGHEAEAVRAHVEALDVPGLTCAHQAEQRGTGHAVRVAVESGALEGADEVVVLAGDVPAITTASVESLLAARGDAAAAILTTRLADPTGYGRVIREGDRVTAVVEDRDADARQRAVDEVNSGLFAFDASALADALSRLTTDNAQGEEYLTDVVALLAGDAGPGGRSGVVGMPVDPAEVAGVNDQAQLAEVEAVLRRRVVDGLMAAGVRVVDPATTYVDAGVVVEGGATLLPGVMLHGRTTVAAGAVVGPWSRLTDTAVAADATVALTVATDATVGPRATVGPYTHLRAGTVLEAGAKAGGFVETKQARIGEGSKVPHLAYVGDADVGSGVNLGAGVITVNYDGFTKSTTTIGDGAFVGSDTMLVAPIEIGPGAYVGAGSTLTDDVAADALAFERGERRDIAGWAARKRDRHRKGE